LEVLEKGSFLPLASNVEWRKGRLSSFLLVSISRGMGVAES
jgi:hypothetical protein